MAQRDSKKPKRVKLIVDLTKYDRRCKLGELGWTIPYESISGWNYTMDDFIAVEFDNGAKLDVLKQSLSFL